MSNRRILLDTNVWIDYFLNRSTVHEAAKRLVAEAYSADPTLLATSITSTRDVYYYIQYELKRMAREEEGALSAGAARAANEAAWACLQTLRRLSFIVPADESDVVEALIMRTKHGDYEDNLVAAAAKRVGATCVVTSDEQLLKHQPYTCVTIEEALGMLARSN